jgi:hypothetical protein
MHSSYRGLNSAKRCCSHRNDASLLRLDVPVPNIHPLPLARSLPVISYVWRVIDRRAAKKKDRLVAVSPEFDQSVMPSRTLSRPALIVFEQLFLFLFGCLLRLLRLLCFLGHVALRDPQSWFNASRQSTCIDSDYTKIAKIDTARFEEGKRRRDSRPDEGIARCMDTTHLAGIRTGRRSYLVGSLDE